MNQGKGPHLRDFIPLGVDDFALIDYFLVKFLQLAQVILTYLGSHDYLVYNVDLTTALFCDRNGSNGEENESGYFLR